MIIQINKEQVIFIFHRLFQCKFVIFSKKTSLCLIIPRGNSSMKLNCQIVDAMFTNFEFIANIAGKGLCQIDF